LGYLAVSSQAYFEMLFDQVFVGSFYQCGWTSLLKFLNSSAIEITIENQ